MSHPRFRAEPARPPSAPARAEARRVPAAALGLGLALFLPACGGPRAEVARDVPPEARSAVDDCSGREGVEKQDCYEGHILAVQKRDGVAAALDVVEAVAALDVAVERDGHVYVHMVGIEAYSPDVDVAETFSQCSTLFQSGCYHGVLQAHFMASGTVDEAIVRDLCRGYSGVDGDRWLLFQCLHGLGHGLTMYFGHDLPRALDACDYLASNWDQESCYGGAFMENILNATQPHHPASELMMAEGGEGTGEAGAGEAGEHAAHGAGAHEMEAGQGGEPAAHEHAGEGAGAMPAMAEGLEPFEPLREDDLHYPCSVLERRYLRACYMMQTSAMLWQNGGDIGGAAAACLEAPAGFVQTCVQSLGRDISSYTLQEPKASLSECHKVDERLREWCYVGLVKNFIDLTARTESAFDFCRRVEDENKPRCYEAIGEEIGVLKSSQEDRREMCSGSEGDHLDSCLYGARVVTGRSSGG